MKTLIITKKDVMKVLTPSVAVRAVEKAFRAYGLGLADMPPKSYLYFKKGDLRAMPAYIHARGFDIAGIKSVNVHPENHTYNLPTVMGVIILTDPGNGFPLAILDGTYLTSVRTGAAGAVASKLLGRRQIGTVGFVGCGSQARTQLACLMEVRKLGSIKVWQRSSGSQSAKEFCTWAEKTYKLKTMSSHEIDEVTTEVDILVTTTPSRKPLVSRVSPGTHINAIGADAEGKQEIDPEILKQAKLVVDDWEQASHSGEINVPLANEQLKEMDIYAELGEIAARKKKGRSSNAEITLFDSTGLAIQDVSCAYTVYKHFSNKSECLEIELF